MSFFFHGKQSYSNLPTKSNFEHATDYIYSAYENCPLMGRLYSFFCKTQKDLSVCIQKKGKLNAHKVLRYGLDIARYS